MANQGMSAICQTTLREQCSPDKQEQELFSYIPFHSPIQWPLMIVASFIYMRNNSCTVPDKYCENKLLPHYWLKKKNPIPFRIINIYKNKNYH